MKGFSLFLFLLHSCFFFLPYVHAETPTVVINGVLVDPLGTDTGEEWVELYNPTPLSVSLTGWILDASDLPDFSFPQGTSILPQSTLRIQLRKVGTSTQQLLFTGSSFGSTNMSNTKGQIGLYSSSTKKNTTLVDYIAYGEGSQAYGSLAEERGIWQQTDFLTISEGIPRTRIPNGNRTWFSPKDWEIPAPIPPMETSPTPNTSSGSTLVPDTQSGSTLPITATGSVLPPREKALLLAPLSPTVTYTATGALLTWPGSLPYTLLERSTLPNFLTPEHILLWETNTHMLSKESIALFPYLRLFGYDAQDHRTGTGETITLSMPVNTVTSLPTTLWQQPTPETIHLTNTASGSSIQYQWNTGSWHPYTDPLHFPCIGTHTLTFFAQLPSIQETPHTESFTFLPKEHLPYFTEVLPDPETGATEKIELFNPSPTHSLCLEGFVLEDMTDTNILKGLPALPPRSYITLEKGKAFTLTLNNTEETLTLLTPKGESSDTLTYGTSLIHAPKKGTSLARTTNGQWISQNIQSFGIQNPEPLNTSPLPKITIQGTGLTSGTAPFSINVTGEESSDPDGDSLSFFWDFGNGTTSTSENPLTVTYTHTGTFTLTLTVTDSKGIATKTFTTITVTPPQLSSNTIGGGASTQNTSTGTSSTPCTPDTSSLSSLFINELLPNPEGSDKGKEWIELINEGTVAIQLCQLGIGKKEHDPAPYLFPALTLLPKEILLLEDTTSKLILPNTNGVIELLSPGKKVLQRISYSSAPEGKSYSRKREQRAP